MDNLATKVAARYLSKKKVPSADGEGTTTIYEYGERQIQNRHKQKAKRIEKLRDSIKDLRKKYNQDLTSKDDSTRHTALVVGLIDSTFERVGNEESADNGHYGVTGWLKKHLSFKDGEAHIKYVGKSGVKQSKCVDSPALVQALNDCAKGLGDNDPLFTVSSNDVNEYLKAFDVTAKDLRGFHANIEMQKRLKAIRAEGPALTKDGKEKQLKDEFKRALAETAKAVGHEEVTLRKQYLVPGLEDEYMKDGTVTEKLVKKGTRTFQPWERPKSGFWVQVLDDKGKEKTRLWEDGFHGAVSEATRLSQMPGVARCVIRDPINMPMRAFTKGRALVGTKTESERENEEIERLSRPVPTKKPPRKDLRRERVQEKDPDLDRASAEFDKDLSRNYKKVAKIEPLAQPGDKVSKPHEFSSVDHAKASRERAKYRGSWKTIDDVKKHLPDDLLKTLTKYLETLGPGDLQLYERVYADHYAQQIKALRKYQRSGFTSKIMRRASEAFRKPVEQGESVEGNAKALTRMVISRHLILNPTLIAGLPLSEKPLSAQDMAKKLSFAYDQARFASALARRYMITQANMRLESLDAKSFKHTELRSILRAIQLASFQKGDALKDTENLPPQSVRPLIHYIRDADLIGVYLQGFYGPSARRVWRKILSNVSPYTLVDLASELPWTRLDSANVEDIADVLVDQYTILEGLAHAGNFDSAEVDSAIGGDSLSYRRERIAQFFETAIQRDANARNVSVARAKYLLKTNDFEILDQKIDA